MNKGGLLLIDFQKDLCYDDRRKDKVKSAMPHVHRAIESFASRGLPVIYAAFELDEDDAQFKRFGDRYCIKGSEGAELIDELYPLKGPVLKKNKHSAFFETGLDELLKENRVTDLYLAGLQTQICIMTTAADASFRGYKAIVIKECVISSRDSEKEKALDWIAKYVGEIRSVDNCLDESI